MDVPQGCTLDTAPPVSPRTGRIGVVKPMSFLEEIYPINSGRVRNLAIRSTF
jgi:hypothetical protein